MLKEELSEYENTKSQEVDKQITDSVEITSEYSVVAYFSDEYTCCPSLNKVGEPQILKYDLDRPKPSTRRSKKYILKNLRMGTTLCHLIIVLKR